MSGSARWLLAQVVRCLDCWEFGALLCARGLRVGFHLASPCGRGSPAHRDRRLPWPLAVRHGNQRKAGYRRLVHQGIPPAGARAKVAAELCQDHVAVLVVALPGLTFLLAEPWHAEWRVGADQVEGAWL